MICNGFLAVDLQQAARGLQYWSKSLQSGSRMKGVLPFTGKAEVAMLMIVCRKGSVRE